MNEKYAIHYGRFETQWVAFCEEIIELNFFTHHRFRMLCMSKASLMAS